MCQGHDHKHEEEIDLVDLLGVIIKRRKFIVWFIVGFTVLTSTIFFLREYRKTTAFLKNSSTISDVFTTKNDTLLASYIFLNKSDKREGYKAFVNLLLFPAAVDAPAFEIQRGNGLAVSYLFTSSDEAKQFSEKFNELVDQLLKLKAYESSMSEDVRAGCVQIYKHRAADSTKAPTAFFSNPKDASNCSIYSYYFGVIQDKLKYVTGSDIVSDYYFSFISSAVKDASLSKVKHIDRENLSTLVSKNTADLNVKKAIKYPVILFIVSVMVAFVMAFVFEFWAKNKKRISGYWR
jgi:hypothetical protein